MSAYPGQTEPKKNKTLTWLAVACFVIGLGLTGFFVYRIVVTAPRTPEPIGESGVVHLDEEGLTIYSSVPVLTPPCEAKNADGADVPLKPVTGSEQISVNSDTWYVVARSVETVPAGDYTISCADDETSATYFAGPKMSVLAFVVSILGTVFSLLIFLGLGITFLTVAAVKNRRRNRPGPTFPGAPGPGTPGPGGPWQGAPGNYPPPGNTFPNQPGGGFPPYRPGPNPDRPQDRPQDR
ncbi:MULTISPECIES: hypothetical protein [unclassified Kribbella]|uniref:hypothetical protein n=1 Tax=unclassified Kribbella TaxID=2644121 RepID=UPI0033E4F61A